MSREFDGSNDYLRIADPASGDLDFGTSAFTLAGWVYMDDYGGSEQNIIRKDPGGGSRGLYLLRVAQTTGLLEFQVGNTTSFPANFTTITSTSAVGTGAWAHVAGVRDRALDVLRVYINGTEAATAVTDKDGNVDNNGSLTVGAWYDDGAAGLNGSPLDGKLAEIGIWAKALSAADIAALAKGFSPAFFPNSLRAYYPLDGRQSNEKDKIRSNNLTVVEAVYATHPRIIYPSGSVLGFANAAAVSPAAVIRTLTTTLMGR